MIVLMVVVCLTLVESTIWETSKTEPWKAMVCGVTKKVKNMSENGKIIVLTVKESIPQKIAIIRVYLLLLRFFLPVCEAGIWY